MDGNQVPLGVVSLIEKAATQGSLSGAERRVLTDFLASSRGSIDPATAAHIDQLITTLPAVDPGSTDWVAEASALTPSTAPSVADQVNASLGAAGPPPITGPTWAQGALDYLGNPPGSANLEGYPGAGLPPTARTTEDVARADYQPTHGAPNATPMTFADPPPMPSMITSPMGSAIVPPSIQGGAASQTLTDAAIGAGMPPPDRGGGGQRRAERGARNDDKIAGDAQYADPTSVFAGIDGLFLDTIAANPDIAAQLLAESRGGGAATAAAMTPQMAGAIALAQRGLLTKGKDLNSTLDTGQGQLEAAEDWLGQFEGNGVAINPSSVYQRALRRARRTDPMTMSTGEGNPGSLQNQIEVTNGALGAALIGSGATKEAQVGIANRLDRASRDYILAVAKGDPEISGMSYPEYLRSIRAQHWLGR